MKLSIFSMVFFLIFLVAEKVSVILLLALCQNGGNISSVTVTKNTVTIRIKNNCHGSELGQLF